MNEAVVIDCCRTPIGRAHKELGWFREVRSDDLAVACVEALIQRTGIDPNVIEDVLMGNTQQTKEQGLNVGRNIGLMAGAAIASGGATINRLCGSSLQALNQATHAIMAGFENVHIVGGLEHMHHIPMDYGLDLNPKLFHRTSKGALMMGITAEFLAQSQGISREDQDAFAFRSHQLSAAAHANNEFANEIIPQYGRNEEGDRFLVTEDQCIRADGSLEALAALKPAFMPAWARSPLATVRRSMTAQQRCSSWAQIKRRSLGSSHWCECDRPPFPESNRRLWALAPFPPHRKRSSVLACRSATSISSN